MKITLKDKVIEHNADDDDDWAQVELFRWQYGKLPYNDSRPLNPSIALIKMADAIEEGCRKKTKNHSDMPSPYNVCEVLRYCSRRLGKQT
jgi:hypothetical protein